MNKMNQSIAAVLILALIVVNHCIVLAGSLSSPSYHPRQVKKTDDGVIRLERILVLSGYPRVSGISPGTMIRDRGGRTSINIVASKVQYILAEQLSALAKKHHWGIVRTDDFRENTYLEKHGLKWPKDVTASVTREWQINVTIIDYKLAGVDMLNLQTREHSLYDPYLTEITVEVRVSAADREPESFHFSEEPYGARLYRDMVKMLSNKLEIRKK